MELEQSTPVSEINGDKDGDNCPKNVNNVYLFLLRFQKVTEWEINKMEVGNEIEIYITLTKYNIHQWHEEGNPLLV